MEFESAKSLTVYRAMAKWLGVTFAMARRRVLRHERMLRDAAKSTPASPSHQMSISSEMGNTAPSCRVTRPQHRPYHGFRVGVPRRRSPAANRTTEGV
jgi:hypothetical protein